MSREISLFNDYHQKENILSNHTGLILKILFEKDPSTFEEVISNLSNQDFNITPVFAQQAKKSESIPDISIEQKSFKIFFETKKFDWFHDSQIDRHLKSFDTKADYKILFLLSKFEGDNPEDNFITQINIAKENFGINICPISFDRLLEILENTSISEDFRIFINEYNNFLERNGYLSSWKFLLEVVNCSKTLNEVHNNDVYICPNSGGMYKHKRAKYFGGYKNKNVKYIHEIKALVVTEKGGKTGELKWKNVNIHNDILINDALRLINLLRSKEINDQSFQVFLLHNKHEANYRKTSPGGMFTSKKYFRNISKLFNAKNSEELAYNLKNRTWE